MIDNYVGWSLLKRPMELINIKPSFYTIKSKLLIKTRNQLTKLLIDGPDNESEGHKFIIQSQIDLIDELNDRKITKRIKRAEDHSGNKKTKSKVTKHLIDENQNEISLTNHTSIINDLNTKRSPTGR